MLLPAGVRNKGFVKSLVHPYAAQIMDLVGGEKPRPAAPWGYTNTWGNNLCLLAGWLVVGMGLLISCAAVRDVLLGKLWIIGVVAFAAAALAVALFASPLGDVID